MPVASETRRRRRSSPHPAAGAAVPRKCASETGDGATAAPWFWSRELRSFSVVAPGGNLAEARGGGVNGGGSLYFETVQPASLANSVRVCFLCVLSFLLNSLVFCLLLHALRVSHYVVVCAIEAPSACPIRSAESAAVEQLAPAIRARRDACWHKWRQKCRGRSRGTKLSSPLWRLRAAL